MRTLCSLCLLKVSSLLGRHKLVDSELPLSVNNDLKIMNLFNHTFIHRDEYLDVSTIYQAAFSIEYDGVTWSFEHRADCFHMDCCPHCDFREPRLEKFSIKVGELSPLPSLVSTSGN